MIKFASIPFLKPKRKYKFQSVQVSLQHQTYTLIMLGNHSPKKNNNNREGLRTYMGGGDNSDKIKGKATQLVT